MTKIPIIVGIFIAAIVIIFALNYNTFDKQKSEINDTQDSPNIIDSIMSEMNNTDYFINENGTKTYVINAVDSPIIIEP